MVVRAILTQANDLVLDTEQLRCTLLQPVANVDKNIRTRSILI